MVSLGKSKFSKLMSVLLSAIMVLSTMAFTLPVKVKAELKEIFYEDFNSAEFNSSTGTVDTTVVSKATLDGTTVDGTTVT
ncbi:MAG: hypothetical protein J6V58_06185, partial [Clostridia bacterium]|nr:hypothetical protein [Clostridia bacterium]